MKVNRVYKGKELKSKIKEKGLSCFVMVNGVEHWVPISKKEVVDLAIAVGDWERLRGFQSSECCIENQLLFIEYGAD